MGDPPNRRGKKPCITEGSGISVYHQLWDPTILRVNTISELTSPHYVFRILCCRIFVDGDDVTLEWTYVIYGSDLSVPSQSLSSRLQMGLWKAPAFWPNFSFFKKHPFLCSKNYGWLICVVFGPPTKHQKWPGSLMMRAYENHWFPLFLRGLP